MKHPILLGLDWLWKHNPAVNWTRGQLSLSCCGSNHDFPVSVFGKGYSLVSPDANSLSVSSVGLGLHLDNRPASLRQVLPDLSSRQVPVPPTFYRLTNVMSTHSIIRSSVQNSPSREELLSIWLSPLESPSSNFGPPNRPLKITHHWQFDLD